MVGVVLAGGAGSRMGGGKAARELAGAPLIAYAAGALQGVCERVAIVAKPGAELPQLDGVELWDDEPAEPRHPLTGIVHALERAGEPVLVCAADMPFLTAEALNTLRGGRRAARPPRWPWPAACCSRCSASTRPRRSRRSSKPSPTRRSPRTVEALDPVRVALPPPLVRSVNTPEELEAAEDELSAR